MLPCDWAEGGVRMVSPPTPSAARVPIPLSRCHPFGVPRATRRGHGGSFLAA